MEHHRDNDPAKRPGKPAERPAPGVPGMVPVADKLTSLAHDLNNLLDGSMRQLALARQSLDAELNAVAAQELDGVRQNVNTAYRAMERMCDILHATLSGGVGSPTVARGKPISLAEAAEHALAVVGPMAVEALAHLEGRLDPGVDGVPAGPVYPLLLNGLRNAIEAVQRTGRPGRVSLAVSVEHDEDAGSVVVLEIRDSGTGLDASLPVGRLFEPGVTSKGKGFGLGLAISAEVARDLGGTLELSPLREGGAVLRARYPVPQDRGAQSIG